MSPDKIADRAWRLYDLQRRAGSEPYNLAWNDVGECFLWAMRKLEDVRLTMPQDPRPELARMRAALEALADTDAAEVSTEVRKIAREGLGR